MQEFTFKVDSASKQPLYRQLYNYLIAEIKSGNLQEGEKLPGKKALAAHLSMSQSTVETAYEMLAAEGYVEAKPRSGFYICPLETLQAVQTVQKLPPFTVKKNLPRRQYDFSLLSGNINRISCKGE